MQVKKEEVKEKIMDSARSEFLRHGYTGASLRVIAEKAGLTKGAVYSYFHNKDDLFCAVAEAAVQQIEGVFLVDQDNVSMPRDFLYAPNAAAEKTVRVFRDHAKTVLDHHESFQLLLFCAGGSSLQNYKERIIQLYTESFYRFLALLHKPDCVGEIFIHTLANTYVGFLEEIVLHEPHREEADIYAGQMAVFVYSGIKKVLSLPSQ
ncbi:MAG TPA: TetR/AcrR family transcriptional regulator [Clostridiales bacterium]|nr:TetR/AcrR family transcriptional regulator [Clostridiales bacterium]